MNKNYESGRRFEYRVKEYLEKKGYYVMRSAGSKSPFDLIAIQIKGICSINSTLLIQCKHGAKISKQERDKIALLGSRFVNGIETILAWSKPHGKIEFYHWCLLVNKYVCIKTEID